MGGDGGSLRLLRFASCCKKWRQELREQEQLGDLNVCLQGCWISCIEGGGW